MADKDHSKKMSVPEGISFALAMSLDAVIAGVSAAGFLDVPMYLATVWNFLASLFAVIAGSLLGRTLSRRWNMDFSWIGGILFLILAFGKMV